MITPEAVSSVGGAASGSSLRLISSEARLTWAEAVEEFSEQKLLEGCSPGTVAQYRFALVPFRRWMVETLGHERLDGLTEADARAYLKHVKEHSANGRGPIGQGRLHAVHRHLNVFFRWLAEREYVTHNPFADIRIDKLDRRSRLLPELTPEHVQRLLAQIDTSSFAGLRDRLLLLLLYDTGLRLSEALSVQVNEDLQQGMVTVVGKGNKEREVGLSAEFRRELRPYLRTRQAAVAETDQPDCDFLFPNQWGGKLGKRTFQDNLRRYGEQAGIEGVRVSPHTLRHSYALNHMREGGDSLRLMYILGHSTLTMTDRYAGQAARDVKDEMRKSSPLTSLELPPVGRRRMRRRRSEGEDACPDRG